MGKSVNLNNLTPEEAEQILKVIQKDFELRQKEKERLSKIEEVISEEECKTELLKKQQKFNENCCIRCCQTFGLLFNRKQTCQFCKLFICKSCAKYDDGIKGYICNACLTEVELKHQSLDWFYNNVSTKYKRSGSAKVVRTLYKQVDGNAWAHRFHSDYESDSGYNPSSLYNSFGQSGTLKTKTRPSLKTIFPDAASHSANVLETDNGLFSPPSPLPTILQNHNTPSVLTKGNVYANGNNIAQNASSSESMQMSTQTSPTAAPRKASTVTQTLENVNNKSQEKKDIYKEVFENTKRTEEAKFKVRFDNLLLEMQQSFENLSPQVGRVPPGYVTTSYSDLITTYRTRVKDLLVSLSQRLELAVESFDETCANNPSLTSQKVKIMISKLVEDRLGESLDLTSDEAVSDLSSLSDDSIEQKSLEDQIAQAVIARVLEIHRNQGDVHLDLNNPVNNDTRQNYDLEVKLDDRNRSSSFSKEGSVTENVLSSANVDNTDPSVPKERRTIKKDIQSNTSDINANVDNSYDQYVDDTSYDTNEYLGKDAVDGENIETFENVPRKSDNVKRQKPERKKKRSDPASQLHTSIKSDSNTQEIDEMIETVDDAVILKLEFEKLRSFAHEVVPKPLYEELNVTEEVEPEPVEENMECVTIDHTESQMDFDNRISTFNKVHDPEHHGFPDFSDLEYEYHDIGVKEIDPDLLSMNLAPIMEETEEELAEDDEESEADTSVQDWRGNWLFKGARGLNAYNTIVTKKEFGDGYVMMPAANTIYAPLIGNIDVDDMSDLSENEDRDLCDYDRFYCKNLPSKEIVHIAHTSKHSLALSNMSVQTNVDSKTESAASLTNLSFSDFATHGNKIEQSSFDSHTSKKSQIKLSEELIAAEGDDPKFEISPESVTVSEGEPAKLTCRVAGTQPIDVFWYKVRENVEELDNSENYDITKDGNTCDLTMYNTRMEEAGQYMCMAINDKGQCSQYFILIVRKNAQELKKPEFLKTLQDVEIKEGQNVKFRCKVKGYPQARVVWYKDGHRIHNQPKYKLERFGNRDYILTIDSATMDDDAEYSVLARNVAGDARSSAQLIVEPRNRPDNVLANENKSLKVKHSEMKDKSFDNFPDLSYLPLSWAKKSKVLQSPTLPNTSCLEELKQTKFSSTKLEKIGDDLSNLGPKVVMTKDMVTDKADDILTCANETNAAESVLPVTSSNINFLDTREIGMHEKTHGAITSTPRSSGTDHIFNPDSETISVACDSNFEIQKDITMEIPQDTSTDLHTSEIVYHINTKPRTVNAKKDDCSKHDTNVKIGQTSNEGSYANEKTETLAPEGHAELHREMPVLPNDGDHMTSFNNNSFTAPYFNISHSATETQPQIVNVGPKGGNKDPYKRDFYVTDTPKMERKTTEHTFMEKKAVTHTKDEVKDVEKPVSRHADQHQPITTSNNVQSTRPPPRPVSPQREKPEPTFLKGDTSEQDLPESRTEFNEEYGSIDALPNVNRLKAMFGGSRATDKDVTVKRVNDDGTFQATVHSITARSVPKDKLDQLRHNVNDNSHSCNSTNVSNEHNNPGRATALQTGQQIRMIPCTPKNVYQSSDFESFEEPTIKTQLTHQSIHISSNVKTPNKDGSDFKSKQTIKLHLSTGNTNRPICPVAIGHSQTAQPIKTCVMDEAETPIAYAHADIPKPILKAGNEIDTPEGKKVPRIKPGAISAMSKFWEKRLNEGIIDDNAPEMLEYD